MANGLASGSTGAAYSGGGGGSLGSGSTGAAYSGGGSSYYGGYGGGYGGYGGGGYGGGGYSGGGNLGGGYGAYDEEMLARLEQEKILQEQQQQASPFLSSQGPLFGSIVPQFPPAPEALAPGTVAPEAVTAPESPSVAEENPLIQERALQQERLESAAEGYRNATDPAEKRAAMAEYANALEAKALQARQEGGAPEGRSRPMRETGARSVFEAFGEPARVRPGEDPGSIARYQGALMARGINPYKIGTATLLKSGKMYVPTIAEEAKAKKIANEQRKIYQGMKEGLEKTKFGIQEGGIDPSNPTVGWNKDLAEDVALETVLGPNSGQVRAKEAGTKALEGGREREEKQIEEAKARWEKQRAEDEAMRQREQEALEAEIRTRQENARIRDLWEIGGRRLV